MNLSFKAEKLILKKEYFKVNTGDMEVEENEYQFHRSRSNGISEPVNIKNFKLWFKIEDDNIIQYKSIKLYIKGQDIIKFNFHNGKISSDSLQTVPVEDGLLIIEYYIKQGVQTL